MGVYLDEYPGALEPRRTPFDDIGAATSDSVFIYMTNRYEGRWSYLMPFGFERDHDPINYIGMGYTQLWIMQKLHAFQPDPSARRARKAHQLSFPNFEDGVVRDDYLQLFHLLREPCSTVQINDHLGGMRQLPQALSLAQAAANQLRCRVLVAKLVHDWTWH